MQRNATHCNTRTRRSDNTRPSSVTLTSPIGIDEYSAVHAAHCNALHHIASFCITLQHTATHCNALQRTVPHCNALQHTVTHFNTHENRSRNARPLSVPLTTPVGVSICLTDSSTCASHAWHDTLHMRDVTHTLVWHDSMTCVT